MNIGDKVRSKTYTDKRVGIIVGIRELAGKQYVDVVFQNGEHITTDIEDVFLDLDPIRCFQKKAISQPEIFWAKNYLLRIEENISENAIAISTNFNIKPLPHQLLTVDFVINSFKPRCLIADEVGLGKTIEAALVYEEFKLRGIVKRVLVVVPAGLVLQWKEELENKFNEQFIIYTKNYIKALKQSYGEKTNIWKLHDKIIVSIDSVKPLKIDKKLSKDEVKRREWHNKYIFEHLIEAGFDMAIIDEAHKLSKYERGGETARYKLGKALVDRVPVLLLLTATPHQGKPELFLNLLKLIDPVLFVSDAMLVPPLVKEVTVRNKKRAVVDFDGKRIFKKRITSLVEIEWNEDRNKEEMKLYDIITQYTQDFYNMSNQKNNIYTIYTLLIMLYQRIASSSSYAILSAMRTRLAFLESDNNSEGGKDENALDEVFNEIEFFDYLLKSGVDNKALKKCEINFLKRCINIAEKVSDNLADVKLEKLLEIIEETIRREENPNLKFIVFTEFVATQSIIIRYLEKYGYKCAYINGGLSKEERIVQIDNFRNDAQIMVSTDAGGEGINLQFCHCMINFDLPWNPSKLEQRIGRIDRIGQKKDVLIFNFHLKNTVEDRVRSILETKLSLIKHQFGEDKFADVLDLLQEEFSFDNIYMKAIAKLEKQEEELKSISEKIYNRAREILEKDDLLLPFSNFNKDPNEFLNYKLNKMIKQFVFNMLKYKKVDVQTYKDNNNIYRFKNPYPSSPGKTSIFRKIAFDPQIDDSPNINMVNISHPLFVEMKDEMYSNNSLGSTTAMRINIGKFQGMRGLWFIFKLVVTNNINRNKVDMISIFLEKDGFFNGRVSRYLGNNIIDSFEPIPNFDMDESFENIYNNAKKIAEEEAVNIFESVKLEWTEEINNYEQKLNDYFQFKKNSIIKIQIDNIRESKIASLDRDYEKQLSFYRKQKNVVPKMDLYQFSYLEFV